MDVPAWKFAWQLEVVHARITVPPVVPYPSPMSLVLLGKIQVLGMVMVAAGSRIVEGGGVAIPAHGLIEHFMLVPVFPGRPRASMTAPAGGYCVLVLLKIPFSTVQMSVRLLPNMLASMKADDPTTPGLPLLQLGLYTPFWPCPPEQEFIWAVSCRGKAISQIARSVTIAKNAQLDANVVKPFMCFSP
jgi:hypothetical protein